MGWKGRCAAVAASLVLVGAFGSGSGVAVVDDPLEALHPTENLRLEQERPLNIAHRGGALEYPENTLYALRQAVEEAGADVIEFDLQVTSDGVPVVLHDATVNRTTDGEGVASDLTLEEVQALDAAYWFVDGEGTTRDADEDDYVYRGIATGDADAPDGFEASDFRIPTLEEVLQTFGTDQKMYVEIKVDAQAYRPFEAQVAQLLHDYDRGPETILASFNDLSLRLAMTLAPQELSSSYPLGQAAVFWASSQAGAPIPNPQHEILAVPLSFLVIDDIVSEQFMADAHASGHAVAPAPAEASPSRSACCCSSGGGSGGSCARAWRGRRRRTGSCRPRGPSPDRRSRSHRPPWPDPAGPRRRPGDSPGRQQARRAGERTQGRRQRRASPVEATT
jgi:glycerophosphoryl diester phosphodiesterase